MLTAFAISQVSEAIDPRAFFLAEETEERHKAMDEKESYCV